MFPKDELLQMIIETDRRGKLLQNASPMINVSEAVHGTFSAHMIQNSANLPNVPLGGLNDDPEAYQIAMEQACALDARKVFMRLSQKHH